eukprot:TRINITY_DN114319_c0_g1_i1.p1 TRINITY_DN114319_c0_g1~~TRINITY_DN114319_c0_g1_i1.p1  ORF type:complete len:360 (-),score=63.60 TRINITY_DN114319_c0_g1_i1:45-1067(-)
MADSLAGQDQSTLAAVKAAKELMDVFTNQRGGPTLFRREATCVKEKLEQLVDSGKRELCLKLLAEMHRSFVSHTQSSWRPYALMILLALGVPREELRSLVTKRDWRTLHVFDLVDLSDWEGLYERIRKEVTLPGNSNVLSSASSELQKTSLISTPKKRGRPRNENRDLDSPMSGGSSVKAPKQALSEAKTQLAKTAHEQLHLVRAKDAAQAALETCSSSRKQGEIAAKSDELKQGQRSREILAAIGKLQNVLRPGEGVGDQSGNAECLASSVVFGNGAEVAKLAAPEEMQEDAMQRQNVEGEEAGGSGSKRDEAELRNRKSSLRTSRVAPEHQRLHASLI